MEGIQIAYLSPIVYVAPLDNYTGKKKNPLHFCIGDSFLTITRLLIQHLLFLTTHLPCPQKSQLDKRIVNL